MKNHLSVKQLLDLIEKLERSDVLEDAILEQCIGEFVKENVLYYLNSLVVSCVTFYLDLMPSMLIFFVYLQKEMYKTLKSTHRQILNSFQKV